MKANKACKSDFPGGTWEDGVKALVSSRFPCLTTTPLMWQRDAASRATLCQAASAYAFSSIPNWHDALIHF